MPRRIDVELTSERPDGTWTWRAAGARQPRGEVDGGLLPSGTKVGDVVRAEAEFDIDGITVVAVLPPKEDETPAFERLEIIGPQREFTPVTSTLATRDDRRDRGDRDRGDRRDRRPRPDRPDRERQPRRERPPRPEGERERPSRPRRERPAPPPPLPERPKPKRLRPGRAHREDFLGSLPPDRRLIAEQLLKGGVGAVRTALDEQNAKARAEGAPEVPTTNILQVAEDLLPASRIADWLDKADAALAGIDEVALSDLRAVVSSAGDVTREERTREMAATLREALDRRTVAEHEQWVGDVKLSMEHGRVVRALRLASRPPEMNQALPDDVSASLATAASAAMTAEIAPDRFATLLDAVAYSPVRRDVTPAGVPAEPGEELLTVVRKHAGRTPAIATLFGVEPPPPKEKQARKARTPRPKASPDDKPKPAGPPVLVGGRRIPPPPRPSKGTEPAAPADATEPAPSAAPAPAPPEAVDPRHASAPASEEVAPAPTPEATDVAPAAASGPETTEVAPASEPEPAVAHPAAAGAPETSDVASASEAEPAVAHPAAAGAPETSDVASASEPEPAAPAPAPATEPETAAAAAAPAGGDAVADAPPEPPAAPTDAGEAVADEAAADAAGAPDATPAEAGEAMVDNAAADAAAPDAKPTEG